MQGENSNNKSHEIALFIGNQIAHTCGCHYSESFINRRQIFCGNISNEIIFQAFLLPTDGKTSEMIRHIVQQWVLMKPFIIVAGKSYKLDANCSVVIQKIGDISCNKPTQNQSASDPKLDSPNFLSYSVGGGGSAVLIVILIVFSMIVVCCVKWKKSKKSQVYCKVITA